MLSAPFLIQRFQSCHIFGELRLFIVSPKGDNPERKPRTEEDYNEVEREEQNACYDHQAIEEDVGAGPNYREEEDEQHKPNLIQF